MIGRPLAFMFSGQGSHYYQMGRELFEAHATFRKKMIEMDDIATPLLGCSVIDTLYDAGHRKEDLFDRTSLTNAAIFMVEYALAQALIADDIVPDVLVGASMGLFAAGAVASAIAFDAALMAAVKLGQTLEARCERGSMIAILANEKLYESTDTLSAHTDLAAVNFSSHFVVSTTHGYTADVERFLTDKGLAFSKLPVSHAFHSRWIDNASEAALALFSTYQYRAPRIPLVCCAHTGAISALEAEHFWSALRNPILFSRTISQLEGGAPHCYIDVGATGTLVTFARRCLGSGSQSRTVPILTPFETGLRNYQALVAQRGQLESSRHEHPL